MKKTDFENVKCGERIELELLLIGKCSSPVTAVGHFDGIEGDFVMLSQYHPAVKIILSGEFSNKRYHHALDHIQNYNILQPLPRK